MKKNSPNSSYLPKYVRKMHFMRFYLSSGGFGDSHESAQ